MRDVMLGCRASAYARGYDLLSKSFPRPSALSNAHDTQYFVVPSEAVVRRWGVCVGEKRRIDVKKNSQRSPCARTYVLPFSCFAETLTCARRRGFGY